MERPGPSVAQPRTGCSLHRLCLRLVRQNAVLAALAAGPAERLAARDERTSGWSVGEHLEHMQRVGRSVSGVLDKLLAGPPPAAVPGVRPIGRLLLAVGYIPRGRARAIASVEPRQAPREQLQADLAALGARLAALAAPGAPGAPGDGRLAALASAAGRFPHPVFGGLDARQWLRFLEVHQHHHLKIIRDIERRRRRG